MKQANSKTKKSSRYIVLLVSTLVAILPVLSQNIDSLKAVLLTTKDTDRINGLNMLGKIYQQTQTDSALLYSYRALSEAESSQYEKGMAEAFFNLANSYAQRGDYRSAELNFRRAINNYESLSNINALGWANLWLGVSLYAEGNFQSATQVFAKAEQLFEKANNEQGSSQTVFFLALNFEASGLYEKAFELCTESLNIAKKNKDDQYFFYSLLSMGKLYENVEDYRTALDYYQQAISFAEKQRLASQICTFCSLTMTAKLYAAEAYSYMGKFDSSSVYLNQVLESYRLDQRDSNARKESIMAVTETIGELHLRQKDYDKALTYFSEPMKFFTWGNNRIILMNVLLNIGKAYEGKHEFSTALQYARNALSIAKWAGSRKYIRDGTGLLWSIYDQQGLFDSAYYYYRQYADMKDSLLNARYIRQLALFKQQSENERERVQTQLALQKESLRKKIALISLFIVIVLAFVFIRIVVLNRKNEKLESKRKEAELQRQAAELEMQALRAQMNPHFIFNSLNAINRFILQNNKAQASEYLTKFSRLIRLILQNSQETLIPLESELHALRLYLEMEALRFDDQFEYKIQVNDDIDGSMIKVPPLFIQPYAENAIWHGLMHKQEKGHLEIELFREDQMLYCRITDDGIGRKRAVELKSKSAYSYKSLGMRLTADRIAMLQQKQLKGSIEVTDLMLPDGSAGGTEVLIKIPLHYD